MKPNIVRTSDLLRLLHAVTTLRDRSSGEEGMGLLHGEPGVGKSTAIAYTVNATSGVLVRARVTWSVTSMLQAIGREFELPPHPHRDPMVDAIVQAQASAEQPRPIFVDEADYLLRSRSGRTEMLDALRDIYDLTGCPVILIGMEEIEQTLRTQKRYSRFDRRVTQRVEFRGMTEVDAQRVAGELCEVHVEGSMQKSEKTGSVAVAGTLVEHLRAKTKGNIGYFVRELGQVERWAATNGAATVTLQDWTSRGQRRAEVGRAVASAA